MRLTDLVAISKALGDPGRLRILCALKAGELCVCQLVELLGLAPSTVSKHLFILKAAGLVETRKQGRWIHCRPAGRFASPGIRGVIAWVYETAESVPEIRTDRGRLARVLKIDKGDLCRRQARR